MTRMNLSLQIELKGEGLDLFSTSGSLARSFLDMPINPDYATRNLAEDARHQGYKGVLRFPGPLIRQQIQ